ncbi:MAG: hypothetical protein WC627_10615 [Legionella sp.]|jgi:hypothetical protein
MKLKGLLLIWINFFTTTAFSFGVDVCFNPPFSQVMIQNCLETVESCRTSNLDAAQQVTCRANALADGFSGLAPSNDIVGARSLLHSDATYLMAQVIGFTPWQAYQMMIYSESTDQGSYTAFDQNGLQILSDFQMSFCRANWGVGMPHDCLIITPLLDGIYKFNYDTGGMLIHLYSRFSPNALPAPPDTPFPVDYFISPYKENELVLNNLRAWVYDDRIDACSGGITTDPSDPSTACASTSNLITSPFYFFAPGFSQLPLPFVSVLGQLIINIIPGGSTIYATNASLGPYIIPQDVTFAKMGIFLHSLGDRISHHMCSDRSYFYPLSDASGNYTSSYSKIYCAQGSHFLWHVWEQGTVQSNANLSSDFQTLRPALEQTYDQLVAYATHLSIPINPLANKTTLVNNLINVLQLRDPKQRLNNMVLLTEGYGALPLPGHGCAANYSTSTWLSLAGAPP